MEEPNYKTYPYQHYSLGSTPSITTNIIDTQIAKILNLINTYTNMTTEQLSFLETKIKEKIAEKEQKYLIKSENTNNSNSKINVRFSEGTKFGGKRKSRKTKRNRKRFGGMETAENVYFPILGDVTHPNKPAEIPKSFKKGYVSIPEENIYSDVVEGRDQNKEPLEGVVLGTTKKSRGPLTRVFHKLSKLTKPASNKPFAELDFDLSLFDDTCLKDVPLTVPEIDIFKSIDISKLNKLIQSKLNYYCNGRKTLFEKDLHFDTKYPKIFKNILKSSLLTETTNYETELRKIKFMNEVELEDYEDNTPELPSEYIKHIETIIPQPELYTTRVTKTGGKDKTKNKKTINKRIRKRTRNNKKR